MMVNLTEEMDTFRWKLQTGAIFSVKSMYMDMINVDKPFHHKYIWRLKVSLKIQIFMWYLDRQVILTKDNLEKMQFAGMHKVLLLRQRGINSTSIPSMFTCQTFVVLFPYSD